VFTEKISIGAHSESLEVSERVGVVPGSSADGDVAGSVLGDVLVRSAGPVRGYQPVVQGGGVNPVVCVPVADVVVGSDRQRVLPDPVAVERVKQSILDVGLLMPIGVTPHLVLIFGATRLAAVKQLGWETIEAREFESAEDPDVRAWMEWEENDARSDLTLEQQMAYKRSFVDPILKARAQARQVNGAIRTNSERWGSGVASGNFPEATHADAFEGQLPSSEAGETRDLVGKYLRTSGRTMEKFEKLVDWSEDQSLPELVRAEARMARERANTLGKVDGEFKRFTALLARMEAPCLSGVEVDAECEQRFVRAYSGFERHLERFDPGEVGPVLTDGSLRGFRFVVEKARGWLRSAEKARDA